MLTWLRLQFLKLATLLQHICKTLNKKMITVKHSNGFVSTYDDTIQPGDLITTYYKGFYEFVSSEDRGRNETPLFQFRIKYDTNGKPKKGKAILKCDASYCQRAKKQINRLITEHEKAIEQLKNIH